MAMLLNCLSRDYEWRFILSITCIFLLNFSTVYADTCPIKVHWSADQMSIDSKTNDFTAQSVHYALLGLKYIHPQGSASILYGNSKKGLFTVKNAYYSHCQNNDWSLSSKAIQFNTKLGIAYAYHSILRFKGFPIAYLPYFTFPINGQKKTGFLFPSISYSKNTGWQLTIPYGFNLFSKGYMTLSPSYSQARGFLLKAEGVREYPHHKLSIKVLFLNHDKLFSTFQETIKNTYAYHENIVPGLNELLNQTNTRYALALQSQTSFTPHLFAQINLEDASDAYLFYDFNFVFPHDDWFHIHRDVELDYQQPYLQASFKLQTYQNLQFITAYPLKTLYNRLPEVNLQMNHIQSPFSFSMYAQAVRFTSEINTLMNETTYQGTRIIFNPELSLSLASEAGFITPAIELISVSDFIQSLDQNQTNHLSLLLPAMHIDMELHFIRDFRYQGKHYQQKLTPHFRYLYIPWHAQNDLPLWDTTLLPMDIDQLFQTNRFSSYDRIGDANQWSGRIDSTWLDDQGNNLLDLRMGMAYFIKKPMLCLSEPCTQDDWVGNRVSPLLFEIEKPLIKNWHLRAGFAWHIAEDDNNSHYHYLNLAYQKRDHSIAMIYYYLKDQLNEIQFNFNWKWSKNWHVFGQWGYNSLSEMPMDTAIGMTYETPCWQIKAGSSYTFQGIETSTNLYQTQKHYWLALELKGLQ